MSVFMLLSLSILMVEPDVSVVSLAFSDDSKQLLSGSQDGRVRLWDVLTKKEIAKTTVKGNEHASCVRFAGDRILVGTIGRFRNDVEGQAHGRTLLLDKKLKEAGTLPGHHMAAYRNGAFFVTEGEMARAGWKVLRVKDGKEEVILADLPGMVTNLAVSADGELLAVGMRPEICLYDFKAGKFQALDVEFLGTYNTLVFAGKDLLLLESAGPLSRWSADGKRQQTLPMDRKFSVAVDRDEVFVGTPYGDIEVWSLTTGKRKKILQHQHQDGPVYAIALSPNGKWMASGARDGKVVFHAR